MLHAKLLNPGSIAVIGGSNNIHKPGGRLVANLKNCAFRGPIYIVNQKKTKVTGLKCFQSISELPDIDLAILAIPAAACVEVVENLAFKKNTRGFIIISAGFSEDGIEGAKLETKIAGIVDSVGGTLIGPNCIGLVTQAFSGIFTSPVPHLHPVGCDFISTSGGTAVFIIESAIPKGLLFSSVYSVGNCAQTTVEDVLEHFDETFDIQISSKVKLLYLETVKNPDKLLKHASSLIHKGCKIAAIKAGESEPGSRAASSHTGAMANSDMAVEGLFRKAGIIRCSGREELTTVASVLMHKEIHGRRIAIITHAGGPAVMLTDALSDGGLEIPEIKGAESEELLRHLPHGSSVKNPIDFLATGTEQHLDLVIEYCDKKFNNIDAMMVIFGSTGLSKVFPAYEVLHQKMLTCKKPIFPILPSILNAQKEVNTFLARGHINFPDEVQLGKAIVKVYNTPGPAEKKIMLDGIDISKSRNIIENCSNGYISSEKTNQLLDIAGIKVVTSETVTNHEDLIIKARQIGYPLVVKAEGSFHKTEVDGVALNVNNDDKLFFEFDRIIKIKGVNSTILQPMLNGMELYIGAKYEKTFGHIVMCGLGGIFVEVLKDLSYGLAPLTPEEAFSMIRSLKSYKLIKGFRGRKGVSEDKFAEIIVRLSSLLRFAVEINEIDLNPLIAVDDNIVVVDARIRVEK